MTTETGVTKQRVLVETRVVVEPGWMPSHSRQSNEARHKWLESWAQELMEFFRDHRHQDVNAVYAEPTYQIQCSGCYREWEEMFDEELGKTCCAGCGKPLEVVT